jgi:ParB/RepB/Spo0J family partition protein
LPELKRIPLADIDEPELPARAAMDEQKLNELADSMRAIGLLQPICLVHRDARYEIEAGHRRYKAAVMLQWRDVPAIVYEPSEIVSGAAMLAENVEREDLSAAEEALLFFQSMEKFGLDESGLMARFKRSADYIGDRMRLLRDDPEVFNAALSRKINFSVARELNKCPDESMRRYFLHQAIIGEVGSRTVAGWLRDWRANTSPTPDAGPTVSTPVPVPDAIDGRPRCEFCGGDRDPYNLVSIYVHKWELAEIQRVLQRPIEETECESRGSANVPASPAPAR